MLATSTGLNQGNAERRSKMLSSAGVYVPLMVTGAINGGGSLSISICSRGHSIVVMAALAVEEGRLDMISE